MNELSRRSVLSGAAAAGAATLAQPLSTEAAAPPVGRQAPGYYRYQVGTHEVTVVTDGARAFPLIEGYVTNASVADVRKALEQAYLPSDTVTHHYAPLVVNTGSKLVVIDTGSGPGAFAQTKGVLGQFPANMAAAGIQAKDVDLVVISHFHADHVNGLLDANNKLAFPNAEVLVPAAEWKFWMDDGEMGRAPKGRMEELFKNNRRVFDALERKVTPYEWNKEIVSGLMPIPTLGHCIGHTSFILSSGSSKLFIQSDVTNNPDLFARQPEWGGAFDQDPVMAVSERRQVYYILGACKMSLSRCPLPFPRGTIGEKTRTAPIPVP